MKLYMILLALSLFICVNLVQAQTFLHTTGTESSLLSELPSVPQENDQSAEDAEERDKSLSSGNLSVNNSDGSVKINYTKRINYIQENGQQKGGSLQMRYGFDIRGKVTNGYLRLFDAQDIFPGITGNLYCGWQTCKSAQTAQNAKVVWNHAFQFGIGSSLGEYRLFETNLQDTDSGDDEDDVNDVKVFSPSLSFYYNLHLKNKRRETKNDRWAHWDIILGFSAGYTWDDNNYRDLSVSEVTETRTLSNLEGQDMKVATRKITALRGKEKNFNSLKLNADMLLRTSMFADKFAIKLFFHSTRRENGDWVFEPGAGFFFPASNKSEKVKQDKRNASSGNANNGNANNGNANNGNANNGNANNGNANNGNANNGNANNGNANNGNANNGNANNETGLIANFLSGLDKEVVFQYNSSGLLNDSPEKTDIPRTYKIGLIGSYRF